MEIKYEAVFGPQHLFKLPSTEIIVVGPHGDKTESNIDLMTGNTPDDYVIVAMRRIIRTPTWSLADQKAGRLPEGWKLVPIEPTETQFGGIARDIIQWLRFTESKNQHSESLVKWLKDMGNEIPDWLYSESEINHLSKHVLSKGTIAAIIYKAMLAAAPEQVKGGK